MSKSIPMKCKACAGLTTPLSPEDAKSFNEGVGWIISDDGKTISRTFICKDFEQAMDFIFEAALTAEDEGHHPDHSLTKYRRLTFVLTTHAAKGLTTNDFVVAQAINEAWAASQV